MKRKITIPLLLIAIAIAAVLILFLNANQPNQNKNGFARNYHLMRPKKIFDIKVNYKIKNFAGVSDSSFFVGSFDSLLLCQYSIAGNEISRYLMKYPAIIHHPIFLVDRSRIYLMDGDGKTIFYKIISEEQFSVEHIPGQVFTKSLMIRPGKFVLRQFIDNVRDQNLVLYDFNTKVTSQSKGLTKLYYDSGMAEEGKLYFDKEKAQVIYVFNKKNSYMVMDTNLKLLSHGNTIDTITGAFEKIGMTKNRNVSVATNNAPTLIYNKTSAVSKGILYNYSKLMADNEKKEDFSKFCNIDKYDLETSKYLGSFYVPKFEKQEIRSMLIEKGILYVGYNNHLAAFDVN